MVGGTDMMYVQALLRKGNTTYVAWIEKKKGLKVESKVTLEPEKEVWTVEALYSEMDKSYLDMVTDMNSKYGNSLR